jgi:hypothetical protein
LNNERATQLTASLRKVLESNGQPFQYGLLERIRAVVSGGSSRWRFSAAEFPVAVRDATTHVDFVLESTSRRILAVECKRVNPAHSEWCFIRTGYTRRDPSDGAVICDSIHRESGHDSVVTPETVAHHLSRTYDLGVELKTGKEGNAGGVSRGAINDATTQVLRGANGVLNALSSDHTAFEVDQRYHVIPAIVTTARLWTTETPLRAAAAADGSLPEMLNLVERDWIWLRHHMSPNLRHDVRAPGNPKDLAEVLDLRYARSVAVVSVNGIEGFLGEMG